MKKAFTLIELLVVISIIALLLSILIPSLRMAKQVAKRTVCGTRIKQLGTGVMLYAANNKDKLPPPRYRPSQPWDPATQTGGSPALAYSLFELDPAPSDAALSSMQPKERIQFTFGFGYLFTNDIVDTGEVFYCPSSNERGGDDFFGYDSYSNGGTNFPLRNLDTSKNLGNIRSTYMYLPQSRQKVPITGPFGDVYFPDAAKKVVNLKSNAVLACDILVSLNYLPHKKGIGAKGAGVNVLATDGSVFFSNDVDAFDPVLWGDSGDQRQIWDDEYVFQKIISLLK